MPKNFTEAGKTREGFYPVGWSQNENYFAWFIYNTYTNPADPPEGYYFRLSIQDLRNDKLVYNKVIYGRDICGNKDCDFSPAIIWRRFGTVFSKNLAKFKIVQTQSFDWRMLPFTVNDRTYRAALKLKRSTRGIINEKVFVFLNEERSKKIYDQNLSDEYGARVDSKITGAIISPSRKRAALVGYREQYHFEDQKRHYIELIGLHLTVGFKP